MDFLTKGSPNQTEEFLTDDLASNLGEVAAKIAYYNFEWRFVTFVLFNTIQALGLNAFLMGYQQLVILKLGRFIPRRETAVQQFVIFGDDASEITSTIRWVISSKYDSNAKFVIVCADVNEDCDELKIFQALSKLYILNVVLLKTSHKTNKPLAYTYQIISRHRCNNYIPYNIDLFTACNNGECFKQLFQEKLKNFHRCNLVMSTVEQPPFMYLYNGTKSPSGLDGDIMKIVADMLNATLILAPPAADPSDAGHFTNNNWTGSLGEIYNKRKHASVCSAPLTTNKYGNFQISSPYYSMNIVWVTRLPLQETSWQKLLHPLNIYLRITILFIFICIIFINIFFKTNMCRDVKRAFNIYPPKYSLLFYSWILFLGMPILNTPAKRSSLITVYTWIWFCFIVRSVYQAALINSLKQPTYLDNLKSFQDVLKDGYPYGGLAALKEYYSDDRHIYDNWVVVDSSKIYSTLDEILDGTTDFVLASNKQVVTHHILKYKGTKNLQIIPEKIVNSPTVVYFKKYSPLTAPLSDTLRIALEAGFVHRTYEQYFERDKKLLLRFRNRQPEPLSMQHFTGCFVLLILGWFLSATYFAVEYVCGNLKDE